MSVFLKDGEGFGKTTNLQGHFTIYARVGQTLVFKYLGFQTKEVLLIQDVRNLSVFLEEQTSNLDEVLLRTVATGYGRQDLAKVSGAISSVSGKSVAKLAPIRTEEALQGNVAGVNVVATGVPGGKPTVFIRGITSNNGNAPLVVIDGVPQTLDDLNALNPYDIAKMDVLKDAATAAIYGVAGGNGVILVTTKSGRKNQSFSIKYDGFYGVQQLNRFIPVLNGAQYATILNEASINSGGDIIVGNIHQIGAGTNWQRELFRSALTSSHNLSVQGGNQASTYFMSLGYNDTKGVMGRDDKSFFKRINLSTKFNHYLNDELNLVLHANYANIRESGMNEIFNALNFDPTLPIRDAGGNYSISKNITQEVVNPLSSMENTYNISDIHKVFGKLSINYQPLSNLKFTSRFGYVFANRKGRSFSPLQFYGVGHNKTNANKDLSPIVTTSGGEVKSYLQQCFRGYDELVQLEL